MQKNKQTPRNQPPQTKNVNKTRIRKIAMLKPATIFNNFCFSTGTFLLQLLCFAENIVKYCLQQSTAFKKTPFVKPTFSPIPKTIFSKEGVTFCFRQFPMKPLFLQFFLVSAVLAPKILARTDSARKCRFFSLPSTNSVCHFFSKSTFHFFSFLMTTLKTLFYIDFFALFLFVFFCLSLSNIKFDRNKKYHFVLKTSFWHPHIFAKTLLWHQLTLFVILNIPPNTIKTTKKRENKSWTSFEQLSDHF